MIDLTDKFCKFRPFTTLVDAQRVIDILNNNQLYCSTRKQLDDVYEMSIDFDRTEKNQIQTELIVRNKCLADFDRVMKIIIGEAENIRICSLAKIENIPRLCVSPLWGNYGNQFDGCCLIGIPKKPLITDDNIKSHDVLNDGIFGKVIYVDPTNTNTSPLYFTKNRIGVQNFTILDVVKSFEYIMNGLTFSDEYIFNSRTSKKFGDVLVQLLPNIMTKYDDWCRQNEYRYVNFKNEEFVDFVVSDICFCNRESDISKTILDCGFKNIKTICNSKNVQMWFNDWRNKKLIPII